MKVRLSDNLNDTIHVRVEKADKLSFIKTAREKGESPAGLIREFIRNYGEGE